MVFQDIGIPYLKNLFKKKANQVPIVMGRLCSRRERIASREEKLNENEYQALAVHTKGKNKRNSYDHPPKKTQGFKKPNKKLSNYECFTCHKMGHMKEGLVKKKNKIFQAHATEDNGQVLELLCHLDLQAISSEL